MPIIFSRVVDLFFTAVRLIQHSTYIARPYRTALPTDAGLIQLPGSCADLLSQDKARAFLFILAST